MSVNSVDNSSFSAVVASVVQKCCAYTPSRFQRLRSKKFAARALAEANKPASSKVSPKWYFVPQQARRKRIGVLGFNNFVKQLETYQPARSMNLFLFIVLKYTFRFCVVAMSARQSKALCSATGWHLPFCKIFKKVIGFSWSKFYAHLKRARYSRKE